MNCHEWNKSDVPLIVGKVTAYEFNNTANFQCKCTGSSECNKRMNTNVSVAKHRCEMLKCGMLTCWNVECWHAAMWNACVYWNMECCHAEMYMWAFRFSSSIPHFSMLAFHISVYTSILACTFQHQSFHMSACHICTQAFLALMKVEHIIMHVHFKRSCSLSFMDSIVMCNLERKEWTKMRQLYDIHNQIMCSVSVLQWADVFPSHCFNLMHDKWCASTCKSMIYCLFKMTSRPLCNITERGRSGEIVVSFVE